jgi:hypothetical protein
MVDMSCPVQSREKFRLRKTANGEGEPGLVVVMRKSPNIWLVHSLALASGAGVLKVQGSSSSIATNALLSVQDDHTTRRERNQSIVFSG